MKTLSQKQFETAVKKVLAGGTSKFIKTREEKPFGWSRYKGHCNLRGKTPNNSKFLRNDGRGGVASDIYLVCYLKDGYSIKKTKAEQKIIDKVEREKKAIEAAKRKQKSDEVKSLALKLGFSSVSKLKAAQKEINKYNEDRMNRALLLREKKYIEIHGSFDGTKIVDRVRISHIELDFDCEKKTIENYNSKN